MKNLIINYRNKFSTLAECLALTFFASFAIFAFVMFIYFTITVGVHFQY